MLGRVAVLVLALLLLAGCARPSDASTLQPMPAFAAATLQHAAVLPPLPSPATTLSLPSSAAATSTESANGPASFSVVLGDGALAAFDTSGGGRAWDGADSFTLPAGRVLAAAHKTVLVAVDADPGSGKPAGPQTDARVLAVGPNGTIATISGRYTSAWVSPGASWAALYGPDAPGLQLVALPGGQQGAAINAGPDVQVAFARTGNVLVNDVNRITMLSPKGKQIWSFAPQTGVARRVAFAPGGKVFFVSAGAPDNTVYAFSADGRRILWKRSLPTGGSGIWGISPDASELVLAGLGDGADVLVLRASDGAVIGSWRMPDNRKVQGVAFAGAARVVTVVGPSATGASESIPTPPAVAPLRLGRDTTAVDRAGQATVWTDTGRPLLVWQPSGSLLMGPDGRWLWVLNRSSGTLAGVNVGDWHASR